MSPFIRALSQSSHKLPPAPLTTIHLVDLKVIPNAKRSQVVGVLGNRLKVKVSAPPEAGKANQAVCKLMAQSLQIKDSQVTIITGHSAPEKTLQIEGLSSAQIRTRLLPK